MSLRRTLAVAALALVASGCASTGNPRDPLEGYNRAMFTFNERVDDYALKPAARAYRFVVPQTVRNGVTNFFANFEDIWIGANNFMQGKVTAGLGDWARFVINSTLGIAGLYDTASDAGLPKNNEDFGQTLGWWGVPSGPYLVLPIFGSSTMRDAPAFAVDIAGYGGPRRYAVRKFAPSAETQITNTMWGLNVVSVRSNLLDASNLLEQAALDRYSFVRDAYLQRRRNLVYDGKPPKLKDDDDDARAPDARSLTTLAANRELALGSAWPPDVSREPPPTVNAVGAITPREDAP
jgi:phospholipid-binding lipoprotein MlaA